MKTTPKFEEAPASVPPAEVPDSRQEAASTQTAMGETLDSMYIERATEELEDFKTYAEAEIASLEEQVEKFCVDEAAQAEGSEASA